MWQCDKCNEYRWSTAKTCNCKEFKVVDEDGEEHELFAMDEQDAALKYAEKSNVEHEYYLLDNNAEISINGKRFNIGAEHDIHYSANEIE